MLIPPEKISEIAQANDIIDVISGYIQVKKRGKTFLALCPFHADKNPSLHISQQKQVYHCFSCKAGGNVFSFIENYENVTFIDAVKKLAEKAGITLTYDSQSPDKSSEISRLYEINKTAAVYFRENIRKLNSSEKEMVSKYLESRDLDKKIIDKFGIGYSNKSWDGLLHHFSEDEIFSAEEIESSGLIIKKEGDKISYYDRFRGRLMFPIFNDYDKIAGFGGRKLYEDDPGGKYINSPESKVYSKGKILYGLNFAKEKIRYYDYVILVEGYMDLIALHKSGIENVVASSGTALTEDQTRLLARYTKNVYLLFDSDLAGIKAAKRGIEILLENGFDISIISLPSGEDPDSFIKNYGKNEFEKKVAEKKSFINFIADFYYNENRLNSVEEKTVFIKEMISYISKIPDKIKRPLFIKEISSKYKLSESLLTEEMNKILTAYRKPDLRRSSVVLPVKNAAESKRNGNQTDNFEYELIELFIHGSAEAIEYLESNIHTEYIKNKKILRITEVILDALINHGSIDIAAVINEMEDEEDRQFLARIGNSEYEASLISKPGNDSLLNQTANPVYSIKNAKDIIRRFRIRELESKRNDFRSDPGKFIEIFEITKEINELMKKNK